jgi:cytochrome P450
MQAYTESMRESTDLEIEAWPVGREFTLLESMQSITLRVIMEAVFGYRPGTPEEAELRRAVRGMIEPIASPRGLILLRAAMTALPIVKRSAPSAAAERFEKAKRAVDEILYAEITRRRGDPGLGERDDVFSALLLASDDEGRRMTDREVRDELVTLLMAGHETTATGLAWTFDLVLHHPTVLGRALEGDDAYLDAVIKEALRIRAVIPGIGRVVRGEPFRLNGYTVPPGVEINPSIRMMHMREDLYPDARAFRPERFLGVGGKPIPDTYTWIPFGGGTRRCLGASFALMEMRIVLRRVLERTALKPVDPELERIQFRAITQAPRNRVRVIQDRPPGPRQPPAAAGR